MLVDIAVYIGPSAFSGWTYHLTIQPGGDDSTLENEFLFTGLMPNTVYFITILPRGLRDNGDVSLTTAWLVQTLDQGQYLVVCSCVCDLVSVCCMCVVCDIFLYCKVIE